MHHFFYVFGWMFGCIIFMFLAGCLNAPIFMFLAECLNAPFLCFVWLLERIIYMFLSGCLNGCYPMCVYPVLCEETVFGIKID